MNKEIFVVKKFNIPKLVGISEKNIEEHLKLYQGYINNSNLVLNKIEEYSQDPEKNNYVLGELYRRFSFEFNGVKNHELYFSQFVNGFNEISKASKLFNLIEKEWDSFEKFLEKFKTIALTRGVGWVMLYYNKNINKLLIGWVDEQHLGHLNGLSPILVLDMWEHSYILDYLPSGKKQYVEDFFKNIDWQIIEKNLEKIIS